MVQLTWIHGLYFCLCIVVVFSMFVRKDTTMISVIAIFLLSLIATGSFFSAVGGLFQVFLYTFDQLLGLILVIAVIVAMTRVLQKTGVNQALVAPFTKLIWNRHVGFWMIGLIIFVFSCFFWPSPAVALIGAFLLPSAMRVGMPPLVVAVAMNLFGHGIALSGDYVIQGTPKLTADATNVPVEIIMKASVPFVFIMGAVTTIVAFLLLNRAQKKGELTMETGRTERIDHDADHSQEQSTSAYQRNALAIFVAAVFLLNICAMFWLDLQGDQATALIMGSSLLTFIVIQLTANGKRAWTHTTPYLVEGFQFAFRIFTPVIPIASFFYLGGALFFETFGEILPPASKGLIYDLGIAGSQVIPFVPEIGVLLITAIGVISGLDGSGYAGISLIGQLSPLFVQHIDDIATLAAWGQVVSIWIGGGTIVPWALLPAAAICGVDPLEVARRNLVPVMIGLAVTAVMAMILLRWF